jgi:hypothetical protein
MLPGFEVHPTPGGLAFAAAAVALGAPVFNEGLRAARLFLSKRRLREERLERAPEGLAWLRGRVALESPLFSPVSGTACAAYRLEVRGPAGPLGRPLDVLRPFRLVDGPGSARVEPRHARLRLEVATERVIEPGQPVSENLESILSASPEARWLRRTGMRVTLVEHVLAAGAECHVVGTLRRTRAGAAAEVAGPALAEAVALLRTGTDDAELVIDTHGVRAQGVAAPDAWVEAGDQLDFLLVGDRPPAARELEVPGLRALGVAVGPLLCLFGLLYLSRAADLMPGGRG